MRLFRRGTTTPSTPSQLADELELHRERIRIFTHVIHSLLILLKEFSVDTPETGVEEFKARLDELSATVQPEAAPQRVRRAFDTDKAAILAFIHKEKEYLQTKEAELKKIIDMLYDALVNMMGENQQFNSRIYERNLRMESITYLEDIRKIKEAIKKEVALIKKMVADKQDVDKRRMDVLSREVKVLQTDLARARQESAFDALTGVYNRLSFDGEIKTMVERCQLTWAPFSILICDLDDFKNLNDHFGHSIGDRVLRTFALECKALFRKDDFIARYGGDEFVIILRDTSLRNAARKAQSLCTSITSREYAVAEADQGEKIRFTISIGVACLRREDTPETFFERADKALYVAKSGGKNRVGTEKDLS